MMRHDASFGKLPLMNLDQMDVQAMLEIEQYGYLIEDNDTMLESSRFRDLPQNQGYYDSIY
jgi:hypothetical protein